MTKSENKPKMTNFIMYLFGFSSLLWLTVGIMTKDGRLLYIGIGILNLLTAVLYHPKVQKKVREKREKR